MNIKELLVQYIKDKPVALVGAGISLNSGVPTVDLLKTAILKGMNILKDEEIKELVDFKIPFESFISSLLSDCSSITKLYDIYNLGKPNLNHFLLAHLAKLGHLKIIVTTNFDTLIEQAFEKIRNTKLKVLYTQKQIKNIDYNYNGTILIKIHGCYTSKRTIATTLNRVTGINKYDYREKVIRNIFCGQQQNKIISLGYSYSDAFDISPAIERCTYKNTEICIVGYDPKLNEIQDVSALKKDHPLKTFLNTKKIVTNFDQLILKIWKEFIPNNPTNINKELHANYKKRIKNNVSSIVRNWKNEVVKEYSEAALFSMVAGIYMKFSEYIKAATYFNKAISIAHKEQNIENVFHYTLGLLMVLDNKGDYKEVVKETTKMLTMLNGFTEVEFYEMEFLRYKGKALQCLTHYDKAQKVLLKAYKHAQTLKRKSNEAYIITLLATNLYHLNKKQKAINYFEKANKIYLKIRDITSLSFNYSELAKLYIEEDNYKEAIKLLEESLLISTKINNPANKASDNTELARVYLIKKEYIISKKYFDEAFKLYTEIEDVLGEAICVNNYAFYQYETGQTNEAIKSHKKAIKIFLKSDKNLPSLKIAYESLSEIYLELHDLKKAKYYENRIKSL